MKFVYLDDQALSYPLDAAKKEVFQTMFERWQIYQKKQEHKLIRKVLRASLSYLALAGVRWIFEV